MMRVDDMAIELEIIYIHLPESNWEFIRIDFKKIISFDESIFEINQ